MPRLDRRRFVRDALAVASGAPLASCWRWAGAQAAAAATPAVDRPFAISAIPDQDAALLNRRFGAMAEYLAGETGLEVVYVPMVDYAALVTAFARGDIQLAWFGGLTGVQAREAAPGARAVAQRPRDAAFHSRFIVQAGFEVDGLGDLRGLRFTFGSESSTSGHLMPRHFLIEAGLDPDVDFAGPPNYSGSHDKTIALVEAGAFQAGAVNEAVWEQRVAEGRVDPTKVRAFFTTPAYYDYNWTIRGDVDEVYGAGTTDRVVEALLGMDAADPAQQEILDLFQTDSFVETENANYEAIREVAEELGILR